MRRFATLLIRGYRYLISPYLPASCRFYPSCSEYTQEAIQRHGLIRGVILGSRRICRCHPFSAGGLDPVPDVPDTHHNGSSPLVNSAVTAPDNNNNG